MDKERQLEQAAERVLRHAQLNLAPPIFELYAALLSMTLAIALFLVPGLLQQNQEIYTYMTALMPQGAWAISFFVSGILSAIGMLFNKTVLRIVALGGEAILFAIVSVIYALLFPNFGTFTMIWLTVFTIASIPLVKYTGIWNNKKGKGEF